ncbi:molybdopterin-dependent oxidoreductase [Desulfitobacterium sp. AusDCA]|uniref:molybdopterin-dependent oxidoreductase n=1 Tax=Desulfitobacterium sp. AusDCA TaxID=3240383 RepID=UPI003DA79A7D
MDLTRRSFLKAAAATAAMSTVVGCGTQKAATEQLTFGTEQTEVDKWVRATCRFCGTGCGVMVGVRNGKVVANKGDAESPVNRGLNCVKGYYVSRILYGKNRLTKPLIRKEGKLVESSWEEALDLVASKYKESIEKNGKDSVGMYASGQMYIWEGYAAAKLFKAGIGTNNLDPNARYCMAGAVTGFMTTFNKDEPFGCYEDIEHADVIILWGNNMAETHPVLFSRVTDHKISKPQTRLIDIATRKTRSTEVADTHLEFIPGTDLAVLNGIANVLITENLVNEDFVSKHFNFKKGLENIGYGLEDKFKFADVASPLTYEDYKAFIAKYTPEYVEKISGVPADKIRELGHLFGDPKKNVLSFWTMGFNQHVRGTWANNLCYNIHFLSKQLGRPGATAFSLTGQPSACGTAREVGTFAHRLPADMVVNNPEHRAFAAKIWNVPVDRISPNVGLHALEMLRAVDYGKIKVLWIMCTNPYQSSPKLARYRKAAEDRKAFIIVSDGYPTRTTELADVVFPSAMWVEKEGMYGNAERRTQHLGKATIPPGEAKDDLWQIIQIANRLGYGDMLFPYPAAKTYDGQRAETGESELKKALWEEYRQFTVNHGKDLAHYEDYMGKTGLIWPVVDGKETVRRYIEGVDPYVKKGMEMEFYGQPDGKAIIWARPYEPPAEVPDADYPFWLCTGRVLEHWHTGTMTRNIPELNNAMPNAYVEINEADAKTMGLKRGDKVKITSRRGSVVAPIEVNGRGNPPKGSVFVPFFDDQILINVVCIDAFDPISCQPDFKKCAVKIEKA